MNINKILRSPVSGHELTEIINNPRARRQPIVEGLVFEKTSLMMASQPGIGKSFLTLQMALEISSGLPVFGAFKSRPSKIYYIQKERPLDEIAERVEVMQQFIPWNPDNLVIDSGVQMFSLADPKNFEMLVERVREYNPEILIIDPIGAGTPGLSTDEGGANFSALMTLFENELETTNILTHHEVKQTYDMKGKPIKKDDSFYGSQWIKAYIQTSYAISMIEHGRRFDMKKTNSSNTLSHFDLAFDPETFLSTAKEKSMSYSDQFSHFCISMLGQNKDFTFAEAERFVGCDTRTLRRICDIPHNKENIKRLKINGKATLYRVLPSFSTSK